MDFGFLSFLTSPGFVIPWYGFGLVAAARVFFDVLLANEDVTEALKSGWPVIIFFFSIIGLILYLRTCRPPGIVQKSGEEARLYHREYVKPKWKKVTGSVIHCVAGDGLGIMTAMVVARFLHFPFWAEFGYEYIIGFVFGWLIFQTWAMHNMGNSLVASLWKGGRAEFF